MNLEKCGEVELALGLCPSDNSYPPREGAKRGIDVRNTRMSNEIILKIQNKGELKYELYSH